MDLITYLAVLYRLITTIIHDVGYVYQLIDLPLSMILVLRCVQANSMLEIQVVSSNHETLSFSCSVRAIVRKIKFYKQLTSVCSTCVLQFVLLSDRIIYWCVRNCF